VSDVTARRGGRGLWEEGRITFVYQDETEVVSCGVFLVHFAEGGG
jgi:hypothetical protein